MEGAEVAIAAEVGAEATAASSTTKVASRNLFTVEAAILFPAQLVPATATAAAVIEAAISSSLLAAATAALSSAPAAVLVLAYTVPRGMRTIKVLLQVRSTWAFPPSAASYCPCNYLTCLSRIHTWAIRI